MAKRKAKKTARRVEPPAAKGKGKKRRGGYGR